MTGYLGRLKAKIQEKPIPHELPKTPKGAFDNFGSEQGEHVCRNYTQRQRPFDSIGSSQGTGFSEIRDLLEFQERIGMAAGSVPEPYLEGPVPLQLQRPHAMPKDCWRQSIDDAGRLLDEWGSVALANYWTPADLFDVPGEGNTSGRVSVAVRSLGPAGDRGKRRGLRKDKIELTAARLPAGRAIL